MIFISSALVLSTPFSADLNSPVFGYKTIVTEDVLSASGSAPGYPVANLANPNTWQSWRADPSSSDTEVYLDVVSDGLVPIDYVGLAKHNFRSAGIPVTILGAVSVDTMGEPEYEVIHGPVVLSNDGVAMFRFESEGYIAIRLVLDISQASDVPSLAVLYVGKLLVSERRVYVGHTPITLNPKVDVLGGFSESANFLGRVIVQERNATGLQLQNLTPAWYRTEFKPFVAASAATPFFFAWRPLSYPQEIAYVWMTDNPAMSNQLPNGMVQVSMNMQGIVE